MNGRIADENETESQQNFNIGASYQPTSAPNVSIGHSYSRYNNGIQNVSFDSFDGEDCYITGQIHQESFSMNLRLNYSITPFLSIQCWGQPFNSIGNYTDFKYITQLGANSFFDQFKSYNPSQIINAGSGDVLIDENVDGQTDYSFSNPDFNSLQWRSNLVIHWQYNAASESFSCLDPRHCQQWRSREKYNNLNR